MATSWPPRAYDLKGRIIRMRSTSATRMATAIGELVSRLTTVRKCLAVIVGELPLC